MTGTVSRHTWCKIECLLDARWSSILMTQVLVPSSFSTFYLGGYPTAQRARSTVHRRLTPLRAFVANPAYTVKEEIFRNDFFSSFDFTPCKNIVLRPLPVSPWSIADNTTSIKTHLS